METVTLLFDSITSITSITSIVSITSFDTLPLQGESSLAQDLIPRFQKCTLQELRLTHGPSLLNFIVQIISKPQRMLLVLPVKLCIPVSHLRFFACFCHRWRDRGPTHCSSSIAWRLNCSSCFSLILIFRIAFIIFRAGWHFLPCSRCHSVRANADVVGSVIIKDTPIITLPNKIYSEGDEKN